MACTWFFLIFCPPRLAKSSLPFRGSASVKGIQKHPKRPVLPSRLERSNTFLILKFYFSYWSLHSKHPTLLAGTPLSIIPRKKNIEKHSIARRTSCGLTKILCQLQAGISSVISHLSSCLVLLLSSFQGFKMAKE